MGYRAKKETYRAYLKNPNYVFYQRAYTIIRDKRAVVDFRNAQEFRGYLLGLWDSQEGKCYYTKEPMNLKGFEVKDPRACTVDRVIPEIGYVRGNIVLCCSIVNRIKQDLSLSELRHWVDKICLVDKLMSKEEV